MTQERQTEVELVWISGGQALGGEETKGCDRLSKDT